MKSYSLTFETPIGPMTVTCSDQAVLSLGEAQTSQNRADFPNELCRIAALQVDEFFAGKRQTFSFPIAPSGTPFQQVIWKSCQTVKYGQTCSYGKLALLAGYPRAARAVGTALGANPILLAVPCHRIVRSNGQPGQFSFGNGSVAKQFLLDLEQQNKK